jgi:CTD nuclear envelope phosphatase 1
VQPAPDFLRPARRAGYSEVLPLGGALPVTTDAILTLLTSFWRQRRSVLHGCDVDSQKMNSLNIISARVSPSNSPSPSRSNSYTHIGLASSSDDGNEPADGASQEDRADGTSDPNEYYGSESYDDGDYLNNADEKSHLLASGVTKDDVRSEPWHVFPGRIANNLINSIRWVLSTLASPGVYLVACLYDENGIFAPFRHLRALFGIRGADTRNYAAAYDNVPLQEGRGHSRRASKQASTATMRSAFSSGTSSSGLSSESESDMTVINESIAHTSGSSGRHTRSKSLQPSEEIAPARRSIRIKLHTDDALRQRKHRKAQSVSANASGNDLSADLSAQLKSPTSPIGALTKYPKTPAPPRPLIPRRQPSYIPYEAPDPSHLKTLILDLDETLIHSMSKGGRMGSGHMVEVRLNTTYVAAGGHQSLGPQHPILYYVHKRPHCDEFLRKVR